MILLQTVTDKPNFGKSVFRALERSGLADWDRVTVRAENHRCGRADQDTAWLSGTVEAVKQDAKDRRAENATVKRSICLTTNRRHRFA